MPAITPPPAGPARYLRAVVLTLGLGTVQLMLMPVLRGRFPFLLFFPAIVFSSLTGGLGPGLLAVAVAVAYSAVALLAPDWQMALHPRGEMLAIAIFAVVGILTSVGTERLRRSRADARAAQAALAESEARLASLDVSKDHFLSVLAHELRQPLQAITMAARGLREPGSDRMQVSGILDRQVQQLNRLVNDLNDLTRIKEGRLHFEHQAFDVRDAVEAAAEAHRDVLAQRHVRFAMQVSDAPLPVLGDQARLQQVVSNLLHNAAQATPAGGAVNVEASREAEHAVIHVRDTGAGIAPELLPEIFSLFVQDGAAGSAHTGVGLALVQSIVARHGGTVRVKSDGPGCGAEFEVRLPCPTA